MARGVKLGARERKVKLANDPVYRRAVFKDLLRHLETGYSIDCFPEISDTAIKEYLILYPEEFVEEDLINSLRTGKQYWEGIGNRQANGSCLGNSRSWYYNMANRYGWRERIDIEAEHKGKVEVSIVNYASQKHSQDTTEAERT